MPDVCWSTSSIKPLLNAIVETLLKLKIYIKDFSYKAMIIQKYKNMVFDFV